MGLLCETVLVPKKRCTPISFPCSIWVPHGTTFDEGKTKFHKRRLDWIDWYCDYLLLLLLLPLPLLEFELLFSDVSVVDSAEDYQNELVTERKEPSETYSRRGSLGFGRRRAGA